MRLNNLGEMCARVRRRHGITQVQVAIDTGYSTENICAFERGRNNNAMVFAWYIRRANDHEIELIREGLRSGKIPDFEQR